jgi:hypothetical protein
MYTERIMSDISQTAHDPLTLVTQKANQQEEIFAKSFPTVHSFITSKKLLEENVAAPEPLPVETAADTEISSLASQITQEEHQVVLEKLHAITQLPPGTIDTEAELYLEQQLSEILHFDVSVELEGERLPHTHGIIQALPHFKKTPTDTLENHEYAHALFSGKRSFFGWLSTNPNNAQSTPDHEKYAVSLPLFLHPAWASRLASLKKWYAFRKVVIVNPTESRAVVACVADTFPLLTAKYQFGASPEVILEGKCWSPATLGRILIFFVNDTTGAIPLGPIDLTYSGDRL